MINPFTKTTYLRFYSTLRKSLTSLDSKTTRVRIWKSGYFDHEGKFHYSTPLYSFFVPYLKPGSEGNIGHVSIETSNIYASLWPHHLTVLNKLKIQEGISSTPEIDEHSEGRPPDLSADFMTL